ncbi:MAG: Zn-dependent hydrolase [Nitrospinota bacterium]
MARVGATPGGGVERLALSEADRQGRDLLRRWMEEAGLQVSVDEMGNMFGRRRGREDSLPPILAGSHLDTVPRGGKFDGALGVLAALEAIRTLDDRGVETRRPIGVVNFTNEEGARFQPAMIGSGVLAGAFSLPYAHSRADGEGKTLGEELERVGYKGEVSCAARPIGGYLELHVEQGPVLSSGGVSIGVVEGIYGITWMRVVLEGEADHAGPTPMEMRKDALVAAAKVVLSAQSLPRRFGGEMVATVGSLAVEPGAINVIPGAVRLTVDLRCPDAMRLEQAQEILINDIHNAARCEGCRVHVEHLWTSPPTSFDPGVVTAVEAACRELGYSFRQMGSVAGHDAKYMADLGPAGMIFVPSQGGKSHCEGEATEWEDVERGGNVLLEALWRLAEEG